MTVKKTILFTRCIKHSKVSYLAAKQILCFILDELIYLERFHVLYFVPNLSSRNASMYGVKLIHITEDLNPILFVNQLGGKRIASSP